MEERFYRIITHNDMDGVVSAALCSYALKIKRVYFTSPSAVSRGIISINERDVVCDLPYPLVCGLWFDHHEGNLEELKLRGISLEEIKGRFDLKPSCSRVVFEFFQEDGVSFPFYLEETVKETDVVDGFLYSSIEDWRKETPGKLLDNSIKASDSDLQEKQAYLRYLVPLLRDHPLEEVVKDERVKKRIEKYKLEEEKMLRLIEQDAHFLPFDTEKELVVIDLSKHNRRPWVIKQLVSLIYPEALAVIEIFPVFEREIKTTNFGISMSLTVKAKNFVSKDIGEIMRQLNIGDGHKGAAGGFVKARSKLEMLKKKEEVLKRIYELWKAQM